MSELEHLDVSVVNAESEGQHVYVLLDDSRILVSRDLETKHCAEIHAWQVLELKLTPAFLVKILGFKVADL